MRHRGYFSFSEKLWGATAVKPPTPRAFGGGSGAEPWRGAGQSPTKKKYPFRYPFRTHFSDKFRSNHSSNQSSNNPYSGDGGGGGGGDGGGGDGGITELLSAWGLGIADVTRTEGDRCIARGVNVCEHSPGRVLTRMNGHERRCWHRCINSS